MYKVGAINPQHRGVIVTTNNYMCAVVIAHPTNRRGTTATIMTSAQASGRQGQSPSHQSSRPNQQQSHVRGMPRTPKSNLYAHTIIDCRCAMCHLSHAEARRRGAHRQRHSMPGAGTRSAEFPLLARGYSCGSRGGIFNFQFSIFHSHDNPPYPQSE